MHVRHVGKRGADDAVRRRTLTMPVQKCAMYVSRVSEGRAHNLCRHVSLLSITRAGVAWLLQQLPSPMLLARAVPPAERTFRTRKRLRCTASNDSITERCLNARVCERGGCERTRQV
jgi:hypothetical protein